MKRVMKILCRLGLLSVLGLTGCATAFLWQFPRGEVKEAALLVKKMSEEKPESFAEEHGVRYVEVGAAESEVTFFFVHGTPGELENWGLFLSDEELTKDYRLLAFDRLGHGGSQPGEAVAQLKKQVEPLIKIAEQRQGKRIWVGHSYGAAVVSKLAMERPELVDGLILVAGTMSAELTQKTWYQALGETWLAQQVMTDPWKVANLEMVALEDELTSIEDGWPELDCPVIVVHAKNDILANFKNLAFVEGQVKNEMFEKVVLEKENHFLIWNSVEVIKKKMTSMVKKVKEK